jgi:hypothetical protein
MFCKLPDSALNSSRLTKNIKGCLMFLVFFSKNSQIWLKHLMDDGLLTFQLHRKKLKLGEGILKKSKTTGINQELILLFIYLFIYYYYYDHDTCDEFSCLGRVGNLCSCIVCSI